MHIKGRKSMFMEMFSVVQKAIPLKTPLQVLKGIHMQTRGQIFSLVANNLELSIKAESRDVEVLREGNVVIPEKIVDIIRQLPDEEVEIKMDEENLRTEILSGKANFFLYGMEPDEFPSFSEKEQWSQWTSLSLTSTFFKRMLKGVIFAVSQDEGKPAFRGVLLETGENEKKLYTIATDTYRLALFENKDIMDSEFIKPFRLLVPGKVLNEIYKIIDESDEMLQCYFTEKEFVVEYKNYVFASRLLDEKYPDLKNVFPPSFTTAIVVNTGLLEKMIQRAMLLSTGSNQMISLHIEGQALKVKAVSDLGRMDEEILLEEKEGEDLPEIFLNARYFIDPLRIIEDNTLRLEFNGMLGPCIFLQDKMNEENGFRYRYLVLPIKTEKSGI